MFWADGNIVLTEVSLTWPYAFAKTHKTVLLRSVHFTVPSLDVNLKNKKLTFFKREWGKACIKA